MAIESLGRGIALSREARSFPTPQFSARTIATLATASATLILSLLIGLTIVVNARISTMKEVDAAFALASAYIREHGNQLNGGPEPLETALRFARQADAARHVEAEVLSTEGSVIGSGREESLVDAFPGEERAPAWFERLIEGERRIERFPVVHYPNVLGYLVLRTDAGDEVAEVWGDFRIILPALFAAGAASFVFSLILVFALLRRLERFSAALTGIRCAVPGARVPRQSLREFAVLAEDINELASHLESERMENKRLQRRLMTLSESERKSIASDLHDGLGPSLFALRAALQDARECETGLPEDTRTRFASALEAASEHADTVLAYSRALIDSLRPLLTDEATLAESLCELRFGFGRMAAGATITLDIPQDCRESYGEIIDISVYRFVQESILNALRHGGARRIGVTITTADMLEVKVRDDGCGPASNVTDGHGQLGIADRVCALDGVYLRPCRQGEWTETLIRIPVT